MSCGGDLLVKGASNVLLATLWAVQGSPSQHCRVLIVQAVGTTVCESQVLPLCGGGPC